MRKTSKILVLVEGAKRDVRLMEHLLHIYNIDDHHMIVSYNTNIYTLYNEMFRDGDPSSIDLLQLLKEREPDQNKKLIFNENYSDILLIFDLDPQDTQFTPEKIKKMMLYFVESSDMGKLYLNYPMVEAFYHMRSIPDLEYNDYSVEMGELMKGTYKQRVNEENRNHDYSKFAVSREECNIVIKQNIEKAWKIIQKDFDLKSIPPDLYEVLHKQIEFIHSENKVLVLCTCAFYISDYNPRFLENEYKSLS